MHLILNVYPYTCWACMYTVSRQLASSHPIMITITLVFSITACWLSTIFLSAVDVWRGSTKCLRQLDWPLLSRKTNITSQKSSSVSQCEATYVLNLECYIDLECYSHVHVQAFLTIVTCTVRGRGNWGIVAVVGTLRSLSCLCTKFSSLMNVVIVSKITSKRHFSSCTTLKTDM